MPADPSNGIPTATRFSFNYPIPALDDNKLFGAAVARPMGIEMQCNGAARLYLQMREAVDEKERRAVAAQAWPLPSGGGFATEFFKRCHPDYDVFPTDGQYFQDVSLGLQKAASNPRGFTHWGRNCKPCAAAKVAEAEQKHAKKKKQPVAAAEPALVPDAAPAEEEEEKKEKKARKKREPRQPDAVHTCTPAEVGPSVLRWNETAEAAEFLTIFTEFGSRNNLRQLLRGAAAAGLYRFHLRSIIANMAMHAWITINGRWLRSQSRGPDAFNPLLPPFVALIFRIRDMRDPTSADALKQVRQLTEKGCNMIEAATKLPLSSFIVLVCAFVENFAKRTRCLALPLDDDTKGGGFDSGLLFGHTLQDIAVNINSHFGAQFDSMTWRLGWISLGNSDLYSQWQELETCATENKSSYKHHATVATASRSTGFYVVPQGQAGRARLYERVGGCHGTAPGDASMQSMGAWFYTAYLPIYMTSLLLAPDRPPLCTDRFYFAIDVKKPPAQLGSILFNEAMWSCAGKYGKTEAAKESSNKNTLGVYLGTAGARPDELTPVRARFSYINARPKQQGHAESSAVRRDEVEKDREFKSSNPRVIPLPSLLVGKNVVVPWHDPNEAAIEHLLPEYFEHCVRWFSDQKTVDAHLKTLAPKTDAENVTAFVWKEHTIARGDRSDFDMYLIVCGLEQQEEKKQQQPPLNSFFRVLDKETAGVCGGQALCSPASTLLRSYVRFLQYVCVLRRVDMALALYASLDDGTHRSLVDGARVFRVKALSLAANINNVYKFGDSQVAGRARARTVRTVFLGSRIHSTSLAPDDTTTKARLLDLLAEILLSPGKKAEEITIEDASVSIVTITEQKDVKLTLACGGTFHLADAVRELARDFDICVRVPAAVLGPFLNKTGDATVIKMQPRVDETEPFREGPFLTAIHATRNMIKSLHPRKVLAQLARLPPPLEITLAATALARSDVGVAATLDSFWTKARLEGLEAEIKAAAQRVLAPPPPPVVAVAAGAAAPFPMDLVRIAKETPEDVRKAATTDLQFAFAVTKQRIPDIVMSFAKRLFAAYAHAMVVRRPDECVREIEMLVPSGNALNAGGFGIGPSSRKRAREQPQSQGKAAAAKEPPQKKQRRSLDEPSEAGGGSSSSSDQDGNDWQEVEEVFAGGAGAGSGSGAGGKEAHV